MSSRSPHVRPPAATPAAGLLLRLFWMGFGNVLLVVAAALLWKADGSAFIGLSVVYWASVGLITAARYVDIRRFEGKTSHGETATMTHWRRHTGALVATAAVVWLAAAFVA
ncbi:MAG: hypothetical protein ACI9MR_004148 [Myxococcota bacterium]|jgi:hypothetical protein